MRPLTFLNGVILGSTAALGGVSGVILLFRYLLTRDGSLDQTVVQSALPLGELGRDALMFSVLALISGFAFWGQVKDRRWRWIAEVALILGLSAVATWFLAVPGNRARDLIALGSGGLVVLGIGVTCWYTGLFRRISAWLEDD